MTTPQILKIKLQGRRTIQGAAGRRLCAGRKDTDRQEALMSAVVKCLRWQGKVAIWTWTLQVSSKQLSPYLPSPPSIWSFRLKAAVDKGLTESRLRRNQLTMFTNPSWNIMRWEIVAAKIATIKMRLWGTWILLMSHEIAALLLKTSTRLVSTLRLSSRV